jgi:hypothetical protein
MGDGDEALHDLFVRGELYRRHRWFVPPTGSISSASFNLLDR